MKTLAIFIGIFVCGLFIENGLAESNNHNGRVQRESSYLPPPVSKNSVREEYITFKEEKSNSHGQLNGDENYQVLEVHNQYKPSEYSAGNDDSVASSYLQPELKIRVQHIYHSSSGLSSQSANGFHSNQGRNRSQGEEIIRVQHIHVNRPNHGQNSQGPAIDYVAPLQTSSQPVYNVVQQGEHIKGPDYLPPHIEAQPSNGQTQSHGHVTHHQSALQPIHQQTPQTAIFKGPHYLPPHSAGNSQQAQHNEGQQHFQQPENGYLAPHQQAQQLIHSQAQQQQSNYEAHQPALQPIHTQSPQAGNYNGPDYLPPHQNGGVQHVPSNEVQQQIQQPQNGYLAPQQPVQQPIHIQAAQSGHFRAPAYLPPHQIDVEQHVQYNEVQQQIQQPASDYLHPSNAPQPIHNNAQQGGNFKAPNYLPPHATQQAAPQQVHSQIHQGAQYRVAEYHSLNHNQQSQTQTFTAPEYLPPHQSQNIVPGPPPQQQYQQKLQQPIKEIQQQLPSGYDFVKPTNAEEAIAELHTLPTDDQPEIQVQSQQSNSLQSNSYRPPQNAQQPINTNYQAQQNNVQTPANNINQVSPQTFPSAPTSEPAKDYGPPVTPVESLQHSFNQQSNVQQFSAARQPFTKYGPPPAVAQQRPQEQLIALPITAVHQQQSGQSYSAHQQNHFQYQQPQQQNLQQSQLQVAAPRSAIISSAPAPILPISQPITSRVRTVQIVNPTAVKTLNILESSDHDGVKTIKILGSSSHQPTGDHRIIKVLTQNANSQHEHVHTVKIFNDHSDGSHGVSNAYLPPASQK